MNKIVIASKNEGKVKEIRNFLHGLNIELLTLSDFPGIPDVYEDGRTFEENAAKKAKAVHEHTKLPALADDSGLEVRYLHNQPGIHSARFSGEDRNDQRNCEKLLDELKNVDMDNRRARFRCILTLQDALYNTLTFEGRCEGYIIDEMKGENGFGYDPLFVPDGYNKTFAELDLVTKNKISHRGKALKSLRTFLETIIK
jgi:XTP/dITP diphosphohydrolase